jgi:hypothetical protein
MSVYLSAKEAAAAHATSLVASFISTCDGRHFRNDMWARGDGERDFTVVLTAVAEED